ncbi:hypothetical protein CHARACLAT_032912, partial [Characodon lateralis]|nr:hypothetical protein [Characodon lateralis]
MNTLPTVHGHTPTGELHPRKADKVTPTQCKLHTQPRLILPPPHSVLRRQGKGPAQCYPSPRPQAQQGRHHWALCPKRNSRPHTKTGQTHPARGPLPAASIRSRLLPLRLRNHTDTPHHCHCNEPREKHYPWAQLLSDHRRSADPN